MECLIRPARLSDAPSLASVQFSSWRSTYSGIVAQEFIDAMSVDVRRERWERALRGETEFVPIVFAAEDDEGEIVGFASGGAARVECAGFDAELYAIYLLAETQGRGIGRHLVRQMAEALASSGYRALFVRVLTANPARGFYERLGGTRLREGTLELGGQPYPEVWYGWPDLQVLAG